MTGPQIAIVGAGPAGCYTALSFAKSFPDASIAVLDRLPIPFGLVRYGVAADHQGTKAVVAQFDRMFRAGKARFLGGVQVGQDVSVESLLDAFDLVVWAGGLARDRRLGIPGDDLPGVYGSGEVSRAWNGHPLQEWQHLQIGPRVAVVGAGNVGMDLVRLLAKSPAELAGSDLDDTFAETVPQPVREITVLVRCEPAQVRWDAAMLRELAAIDGVSVEVDAGSVDAVAEAAAAEHPASVVLAELAGRGTAGAPRVAIHFSFGTRTDAIDGERRVTRVTVDRRGSREQLAVDTVLTAIGFEIDDLADHPRLFRAGWARTGPQGTIPSLRGAARDLAVEVEPALAGASRRAGLDAVPGVAERSVSYHEWTRIDDFEIAGAPADRCRRKLRDLTLLPHIINDEAVNS